MVVYGQTLGLPSYDSEWRLLVSQTIPAELYFTHELGEVPVLVDVLVKALDGPNEGFIFRAAGTAERDDDQPDPYGGVIYIYNDQYVRVMAPWGMNHNKAGGSIYTGDPPYWAGGNFQLSYSVMVKVRCWTKAMLPPPCFNMTGISMKVGSTLVNETFREINHGINGYPSLVRVRTLLHDSIDIGWYSDGQGAAQMNYNKLRVFGRTGGLKYAYNNESVRIWTSADNSSYLETHIDGWGNDRIYIGYPSTGSVEVRVWCNIATLYEQRIEFGPSATLEQFELLIPHLAWEPESVPISITIEAMDGPNVGYRFIGSGSAFVNTPPDRFGTPCSYGGFVYAVSKTAIRFWRPDDASLGGTICIPNSMGDGTYAQSSLNGILDIKLWLHPTMRLSEQVKPIRLVCSSFILLKSDTAYNTTAMATVTDMSNIVACDEACRQHETCITFTLYNNTCNMYNTSDQNLYYQLPGSQVWGLDNRSVKEIDVDEL
ncbi:hypothetical protein ACF0H5_009985 [Mactra antiquata]